MKPWPTIEEKFWNNIDFNGDNGCWLWKGRMAFNDPKGYGEISYGCYKSGNRVRYKVHRYSWMIHNGPIPEGLQVCHHCDIKICVNPNHLFLGSQKDNMQDMVKKGRNFNNHGGVWTEERRDGARRRRIRANYSFSQETKEKMRLARIGKCAGINHPFWGKSPSEETLKKRSVTRKHRRDTHGTFNEYKIEGDTAVIYLNTRNGEQRETVIDLSDLEKILNYPYSFSSAFDPKTKKYYAAASMPPGNKKKIKLHRFLLFGIGGSNNFKVVHIDHDGLNNRRNNLMVMSQSEIMKLSSAIQ